MPGSLSGERMTEFPPNLDDGELWLPSDIFFPEEVPSKFSPHFSSELTFMDDLSQRFASCVLLPPHQTSTKPLPGLAPNLQLRLPVRYGPGFPQPDGYLSVNGGLWFGHDLSEYGTAAYPAGRRPFYQHHLPKPVHPQVESFVEPRAGVLQRQQNQVQTRFFPLKGGEHREAGMRGFARESVGTGVFLPRVVSTTASATTDPRKKQSWRSRPGNLVTPQRNSLVRVGVGKLQECHCQQLPLEMGLPQDWTY